MVTWAHVKFALDLAWWHKDGHPLAESNYRYAYRCLCDGDYAGSLEHSLSSLRFSVGEDHSDYKDAIAWTARCDVEKEDLPERIDALEKMLESLAGVLRLFISICFCDKDDTTGGNSLPLCEHCEAAQRALSYLQRMKGRDR